MYGVFVQNNFGDGILRRTASWMMWHRTGQQADDNKERRHPGDRVPIRTRELLAAGGMCCGRRWGLTESAGDLSIVHDALGCRDSSSRLDFDKMFAMGDGDGFDTAGGSELGEDGRDDLLDCVFRDAESLADVDVGAAGGKGGENLQLMFGQGRMQAVAAGD